MADPQLVDPHTYPGRPWPLSTLTVFFTDLYLRRSFSLITEELSPDTVFFLGDLFDGGREWSTLMYNNEDLTWQKYGQDFWLKEYERFRKIFFDIWLKGDKQTEPDQRHRKIVAGLPGNHDLGIGAGVKLPIRQRFNAYFGDGNRVDIIGNHSFISIDSVSLTAWKPIDTSNEEIWKPTVDFLDDVHSLIERAQSRSLTSKANDPYSRKFEHTVRSDSSIETAIAIDQAELKAKLPAILLTHVPLYRDPGTPCGPLREHWPPSLDGMGIPAEVDKRNAIDISAGYQYQNVLTTDVSKMVTDKIGDLSYAFSGDDHDYCNVLHTDYKSSGNGIREITVKSMSWAMGVRKPGFVMLSLWNPVHDTNRSDQEYEKWNAQGTLQSELCLLPDQLGIFICYGLVFGATFIVLIMQATWKTFCSIRFSFGRDKTHATPDGQTLLFDLEENIDVGAHRSYINEPTSSNPSSSAEIGKFSSRATGTRARSVSSANDHNPKTAYLERNMPLQYDSGHNVLSRRGGDEESWVSIRKHRSRRLTGTKAFLSELRQNITWVGVVVFCWYFLLIWRG